MVIANIVALAGIVVIGIMIANAIANPTGTKVVVNGVTDLWKTSVNGLLAKAS